MLVKRLAGVIALACLLMAPLAAVAQSSTSSQYTNTNGSKSPGYVLLQSPDGSTTKPVTDTTPLPVQAAGVTIITGASFTTPAGTTPYGINDAISNSATAGSVTPMQFTVCRTASTASYTATGMVRRVRVKTTDTGAAGAGISLDLYRDSPTVAGGDNAAASTSESNWLGSFDVTLDQTFTNYRKGIAGPAQGSEVNFDCAIGSQVIYGLLRTPTGFTPVGAATWTIVLEVLGN